MSRYEVVDVSVVTCDGKRALADVSVWVGPQKTGHMKTVRVEYVKTKTEMRMSLQETDWDPTPLEDFVLGHKDVRDEINEAVAYQRDLLKGGN